MNIFILTILILLAALPVTAQVFTVSGSVATQGAREPVIGVTVQIRSTNSSSQQRFGARTNKNGQFAFPAIPSGEYDISVKAIGYKSFTTIVVVKDNTRLNIIVEQEDVRLQRVSVEAEQISPTLVGVVSLTGDEIKRLPALGAEADVMRAIQLLPGVKAANEVSSGLYIRGGSPDQTLILFDGVTIYNPAHLFGIFSSFNPDAVSDVRLYKGAFPAEYGGRLSSVLDVTMKEGSKERLNGSASVSLISAHVFAEGPIGDKTSFMVSGRSMYLGALAEALQLTRNIPWYNFYDINAKLTTQLSDNDRISVSGYYGRDDLKAGETYGGTSFGWGNTLGQAKWQHIFSETFFTTLSASYSSYGYSYNNQPNPLILNEIMYASSSFISDANARFQGNYIGLNGHNIEIGVEAISRSVGSITRQSQGIIDVSKVLQETNNQAIEASIFVQDDWQIASTLSANLGIRGTYFSNGSYLRLEPRASLAWQVSNNCTIKAATALTNQFTHRIENGLVGNPSEAWFMATSSIQPSQALQFVIGAEFPLFEGEYQLSVEAYATSMQNLYDYKDSIQFRRGIPPIEQLTIGSGQAWGLEILLQKRVGQLTGWVGYTLAQTSRLYPELNGGKPFDAPFDRRHEVQATASYKLNDVWEFGATFVFGSGQPFTVPVGIVSAKPIFPSQSVSQKYTGNETGPFPVLLSSSQEYSPQRSNVRLPAFHRLDVSATHKFTWFSLPFELNISIVNLYNQQNPLAWRLSSTGSAQTKISYTLDRIYALPILPTVGLRFIF
jgi:outer membrane cobalamin receptor